VPSIETLEKFAHALEVPMYQLFYDSDEPAKPDNLPKQSAAKDKTWGSSGRDSEFLEKFRRVLSKTSADDKKMLMFMAQKMAGTTRGK